MAKKHTSVEIKIEAIQKILDGKKSVIEVADDLGLHRDTVNRWVNLYKENGEDGLKNPNSHQSPQSKNNSQKVKELEKKLKEKELRMRY
ncbi:transposase [Neobacillus sp. 19]|uniref:transposase n=1 Tax=Neobacillus sp. 19 TaxID=3394458 RepID=UPI003BF767F6